MLTVRVVVPKGKTVTAVRSNAMLVVSVEVDAMIDVWIKPASTDR